MKLTSKKVKDYFAYRTEQELEHCPDCIAAVCNDMVIKYNNEFGERLNVFSHGWREGDNGLAFGVYAPREN